MTHGGQPVPCCCMQSTELVDAMAAILKDSSCRSSCRRGRLPGGVRGWVQRLVALQMTQQG